MIESDGPKYIELMEWIRSQILSGHLIQGTKLPSENELGQKFSISRQTVRQATSVLESEGLLERRRGSGTYVLSAKSQYKKNTKNIGVVLTYIDDYIFPSIIKGIEKVLTQNDYFMQLAFTYNKTDKEYDVCNTFLQSNIDGLIIEPAKSGIPFVNQKLYRRIGDIGIPYILIHAAANVEPKVPSVCMDDYNCGEQAAQYLIEHGHCKIAGIFKADDMQGQLRYSGAMNILKKYDECKAYTFWYTTEDIEDIKKGDLTQVILNRFKDATAIICYNDQMAKTIISMFKSIGKNIPEEISIISFDDLNVEISSSEGIGLTSFVHPKEKLGIVAAKQLIQLINNPQLKETAGVKFAPKLAERNSVRLIKN